MEVRGGGREAVWVDMRLALISNSEQTVFQRMIISKALCLLSKLPTQDYAAKPLMI